MIHNWSRCFFAIAMACSTIAVAARSTHCDICDQKLGRRSWTYNGQRCCSEQCVDELRPACSVCGKTIRGEYSTSEGELFCGSTCFESTLSKCDICNVPIRNGFTITRHTYCEQCVEEQPTCFSCGLPAAHPTRLKDDRPICGSCMRWSVKTQEMAQRHYDRARKQLEAWTSLRLKTVPELVLVDRNEIQRLSQSLRKSDSPVSVRGLYSRQVIVRRTLFGAWKDEATSASEKIYIVDHLTDEVFRVAATHELMHDLIHEYFPRLEKAPLWVHEGICQQAAAELCRRRNYGDTLYGIENCTDPDYGAGYRYINKQTGFEGWRALRRWMETVDISALPKKVPD